MKAAPSDSASYIDQMIATERENQKPGYATRIEELEKERKSAVLLDKVIHGGNIEGFQKIKFAKGSESWVTPVSFPHALTDGRYI